MFSITAVQNTLFLKDVFNRTSDTTIDRLSRVFHFVFKDIKHVMHVLQIMKKVPDEIDMRAKFYNRVKRVVLRMDLLLMRDGSFSFTT